MNYFFLLIAFLISSILGPELYAQNTEVEEGSIPPEILNPTYLKVMSQIENEYKKALELQAKNAQVLPEGVAFNGQGIGLSWRQEYSSFRVRINRGLAPSLFDDKSWIINDEFEIELNLMAFLQDLIKNNPDFKLPAGSNIAAFAGVKLTRLFRFMHQAPTLQGALFQNIGRLLTPFQVLLKGEMNALRPGEFVERIDYLGFEAAGGIHVPLYGPFFATAAANIQYGKLSHVSITKNKIKDNLSGEQLDIQYESAKLIDLGIGLNLQLDLIQLIKTNIFEVDFHYEHEKSAKKTLTLNSLDLDHLDIKTAVKQVVHGKWGDGEEQVLAPFVMQNEDKEKEIYKLKISFLNFEAKTVSSTESLSIKNKEGIKNYFHHEYNKSFTLNDPLTWLFGGFLGSIASSFVGIKTPYLESKKISIEYQHEKNILDKKDFFDSKKSELSAHFENHFKLGLKFPILHKNFKNKILRRIEGLTSLPISIVQKIKENELLVPFKLSAFYEITDQGIYHMNLKSEAELFSQVLLVCANAHFPARLFNGCQKLKKHLKYYWSDLAFHKVTASVVSECRDISKKHRLLKACIAQKTYKLVEQRNDKIPLWRLKNFFDSYFLLIKKRQHLYQLLGEKGLFIHGSLSAKTKEGRHFVTHFKEGQFQGLGVIDKATQIRIREE